VQTTLTYLQSLDKDAAKNGDMREALTEAYYKLALVQGDPNGPGMGDAVGAEKSLHKAEEILRPAYRLRPDDSGLMLRFIEVRATLADLLSRQGRKQESLQIYIDLVPVAHHLSSVKGCTLDCEKQEPVIESMLASQLLVSDPRRSREFAQKGVAADLAIIQRYPAEEDPRQGLGTLDSVAAQANMILGHLEEAAKEFQTSIAIREEVLRTDPKKLLIRRNLSKTYGNYALLLGFPWSPNLGRFDDARVVAQKSVEIAQAANRADPADLTARRDLATALARLGMIEPAPGDAETSMRELKEAEQLVAPLVAADAKAYDKASLLAQILAFEGHLLEQFGLQQRAGAAGQRALDLLAPFVSEPRIGM